MNVSTITLLFKVILGYMFRLDLVILRPILAFVLPDTVQKVCSVSGDTNVNIGLRMTKSNRNM